MYISPRVMSGMIPATCRVRSGGFIGCRENGQSIVLWHQIIKGNASVTSKLSLGCQIHFVSSYLLNFCHDSKFSTSIYYNFN